MMSPDSFTIKDTVKMLIEYDKTSQLYSKNILRLHKTPSLAKFKIPDSEQNMMKPNYSELLSLVNKNAENDVIKLPSLKKFDT